MFFYSVEGHSIYIRNLPLYTKSAELEAEFKRFGPIKLRGIQVRNSKVCFKHIAWLNTFVFYEAWHHLT